MGTKGVSSFLHNVLMLLILMTIKSDTSLVGASCEITSTTNYKVTDKCAAEVHCDVNIDDIPSFLPSMWPYCEKLINNYYNPYHGSNGIISTAELDLHLQITDADEETLSTHYFAAIKDHIKTIRFINGIKSVPIAILSDLPHLTIFAITNGTHEILNLNNFLGLQHLEEFNVTQSYLKYLETELTDQDSTSRTLIKVDLSHNLIEVIPNNCFSHFPYLQHLNISYNSIAKLDILSFEGISRLQTLQLSHNKLLEIGNTLARFVNLIQLSLDHNSLTSIMEPNFGAMVKLEKLNLSSNKVESIENQSFQSIVNLEELDLSYNQISVINNTFFKNNDRLHLLDISNNKIQKITSNAFTNLTSLIEIDLSNNVISEIKSQLFLGLKNIRKLKLSNNIFSGSVEYDTFSRLLALTNVELAYTRVASLQDGALSGMDLKCFNISHGELTDVKYNAFNSTISIEVIDVSYNLLESFLVNTTSTSSVKELYLNNNKLKNVSTNMFLGLVYLQKLDLSDNSIVKIESKAFCTLSSLTSLDLASNVDLEKSDTLFDDSLLIELSLKNIKRPFIFEHARNLSVNNLDLSFGTIYDVNTIFIFRVKNVTDLNLSNNIIVFIDKFSFCNMPTLRTLDLSFNSIAFIQPGTFLKTNNLLNLNLHSNKLQDLQFGIFGGLTNLQTLNLSRNSLHNFSANLILNTPNVSFLFLDDNAIENIEFGDFSESFKKITIGGNLISCHKLVLIKNMALPFIVTAEFLDYHSENVDGIRCVSNSKNNRSLDWTRSTTDVNTTFPFVTFANAVESFRAALNQMNSKNSSDEYNFSKEDLLNNIEVQNRFMKQLTENDREYLNNQSRVLTEMLSSFKNSQLMDKTNINTEINQMMTELKSVLDQRQSDRYNVQDNGKETHGSNDVKALLYFFAFCLVVMIGILVYVAKSSYTFFKGRRLEAADIIEMQH